MADTSKQVRIKLVKSPAGRKGEHRACARGLGLKRMHQSVTVADTPENRGMIRRISDMLEIEDS